MTSFLAFLESIKALVDVVARYAVVLTVICAIVLFLPDGAIQYAGLIAFRDENRGWLFLLGGVGLLISMQAGAIGLWNRVSAKSKERGAAEAAKATKELKDAAYREAVNGRLSALSDAERSVVSYCVWRNQQTIVGPLGDPILGSLSHKELMVRGGGNMNSLPWSFRDEVWKMIQSQLGEFMPTTREDMKELEKLPQLLRDSW